MVGVRRGRAGPPRCPADLLLQVCTWVLKDDLAGVFRPLAPRQAHPRDGSWRRTPHDLITSTFSQLGITGSRIVITSLREQVFIARLHLRQNGHEIDVDSRASDAIALAVRFECPIFVAAEVLDSAGVIPEKDEKEVPEEKVDEGRLAVFRDLFNSPDLPDLPDEPGSSSRGSSSS